MKKGTGKLALGRETFRALSKLELTSVDGGDDIGRMVTGGSSNCIAVRAEVSPKPTEPR